MGHGPRNLAVYVEAVDKTVGHQFPNKAGFREALGRDTPGQRASRGNLFEERLNSRRRRLGQALEIFHRVHFVNFFRAGRGLLLGVFFQDGKSRDLVGFEAVDAFDVGFDESTLVRRCRNP